MHINNKIIQIPITLNIKLVVRINSCDGFLDIKCEYNFKIVNTFWRSNYLTYIDNSHSDKTDTQKNHNYKI